LKQYGCKSCGAWCGAQACGLVSAARYTSEALACAAGSTEFVIPQGAPWASPLGFEVRFAASSVVPRMPMPFRQRSLESGFELANVHCGLDRQGWITVFAALVLAVTDGDKCPLEFKRS